MKNLAGQSHYPAMILLHVLAFAFLPGSVIAASPCRETGESALMHREWAVSPAVGFVFGGLLADAPGSDDIAYGVRVSHRLRPGLRTVYSVSSLGRTLRFVFLNARADYFFRRDALLEPFASAGAGLITGDTGSEFDFLFGAGLEVSLTDRFSVEEAAIVHLSPAQALTDREGNPFTVLESSMNFRF